MGASAADYQVVREGDAALIRVDSARLAGASERLARQIHRGARQVLGAKRSPAEIISEEEDDFIEARCPLEGKRAQTRYETLLQRLDARISSCIGVTFDPIITEQYLGITRSERKRWTSDKRLPVVSYRTVRLPGAGDVEAPCYCARSIRGISAPLIEEWRARDREASRRSRAEGARKAATTRKELAAARAAEQQRLTALSRTVARELGNPTMTLIAETFILTQIASRYARDGSRSRFRRDDGDWLQIKDRATLALIRSGALPLTFLPGDTKWTIDACRGHREEYFDMREMSFGYLPFMDWARDNMGTLKRCPKCYVERQRDYYALYALRLRTPSYDGCLYLPYPLGRQYELPKKSALPRDPGERRMGTAPLGRGTSEDERTLYPEGQLRKRLIALCERLERIDPGAARAGAVASCTA